MLHYCKHQCTYVQVHICLIQRFMRVLRSSIHNILVLYRDSSCLQIILPLLFIQSFYSPQPITLMYNCKVFSSLPLILFLLSKCSNVCLFVFSLKILFIQIYIIVFTGKIIKLNSNPSKLKKFVLKIIRLQLKGIKIRATDNSPK